MMPISDKQALAELLNFGLRAHEIRLERRQVERLAAGWPQWVARQDFRSGIAPELLAARYLKEAVAAGVRGIGVLRAGQEGFTRRYALAASDAERRQTILDYAKELGASRSQLRGDARAFRRWFGPDAMQDRTRVLIAQEERSLCFCLQALGRVAARHLAQSEDAAGAWHALALEESMLALLDWDGGTRVRFLAFEALSRALQALPPALADHALSDAGAAYVYRAALDQGLDVWIQREALQLLSLIAQPIFMQVAEKRLREPGEGDDLFVRRHVVELLAGLPEVQHDLLAHAQKDPSAYVRQGLAQVLARLHPESARRLWPALGSEDEVHQVRAAAVLQLPHLAEQPELFEAAVNWLAAVMQREQHVFVLRVALKTMEDGALRLSGEARKAWAEALLPRAETLHVEAKELPVRRWAAETRERIVCLLDPASRALARHIEDIAAQCAPGGSSARLIADAPVDRLGRVLASAAQRDHGIELEQGRRGWRVWRGHRFGFRLWRFLHEWKHPSPDKRQAFRHTIGRTFRGTVRAPSAILGELAQTKVPGEPLHMASEAGWRPYLPLVDELISLLDESPAAGPLRLYTAEGVTEVSAPAGIARRLVMRATLTREFERYASARNWTEGSAAHPASYLRMITELGFEVRYRPYPDTRADAAVTRFFPALGALPLPELQARLENYFYSAYDNTLFDLALFVGVAVAGFIGHHLWVNHRMRQAREAIPLVVGGWGTRGKSGTERLKAGLFNALGYSVVSKTTGCEAMFLYAAPQGELREMFLFRPYDKATIWEQYNVVRLARRLGCEVFLWECMALTPAFVRLLQRAWMRDDYSTLTNTFPDHEDLQGPAGINIPQVMTEFIPKNRVLLTSEEQMRPILRTAADRLGTELRGVGWLESGLIAPDILARFPYQEHPDNIALVAALGKELGIGQDFALKAMADKVVPDLGVLKTFAPARVSTRVLEFSNGMSANERYGCLGNWRRLGFAQQDPLREPGVCISTVVNNRADRIARSRVFAGVLTQDIRADFHVLIGSNLDGMRGYLRESWESFAQGLTLWPNRGAAADPAAEFERLAREHRIVHSQAQLAARLAVMLEGIGASSALVGHSGDPAALKQALNSFELPHADEALAFHERDLTMLKEYEALAARCRQAGANTDAALDQAMREQMWRWFERRIVVVENYYATGDAVIAAIRDATPPGFRNRIMGLQNIKGTGLDFVYRWLAWDSCHRMCKDALSRDAAVQRRALSQLAGFQEYGLLSEEEVATTLAALQTGPLAQQARLRAELATIAANCETKMAEVRAGLTSMRSNGWKEWLIDSLEAALDAGDAVRRRRRADRIYEDLAMRRIGEARATLELQALTRRQKGGWFAESIEAFVRRLRRPARGANPDAENAGAVGAMAQART